MSWKDIVAGVFLSIEVQGPRREIPQLRSRADAKRLRPVTSRTNIGPHPVNHPILNSQPGPRDDYGGAVHSRRGSSPLGSRLEKFRLKGRQGRRRTDERPDR